MLHEAARAYLGVPFLHQGRDPRIGLDCVGLIVRASADAGLSAAETDVPRYGRKPREKELLAGLCAAFGPPVDELEPGLVVALRYPTRIRHVGILGDHPHGLSLIHVDSRVGRWAEHRLDDRWRDRIAYAWRAV